VLLPDRAAGERICGAGGRRALVAGSAPHPGQTARSLRNQQNPGAPALAHHQGSHRGQ